MRDKTWPVSGSQAFVYGLGRVVVTKVDGAVSTWVKIPSGHEFCVPTASVEAPIKGAHPDEG